IGSSMSSSPRTPTEPGRTTPPKTSQLCGGPRPISYVTIPLASLCPKKSNKPDGTTPSCSISSPICDSPALWGRGSCGGHLRPSTNVFVGSFLKMCMPCPTGGGGNAVASLCPIASETKECTMAALSVGVIGVEALGSRVALRLLWNGFHTLQLYDVNDISTRQFTNDYGGMLTGSPKMMAQSCDAVITVLPSAAGLREVCFGWENLAKGFSNAGIVINLGIVDALEIVA